VDNLIEKPKKALFSWIRKKKEAHAGKGKAVLKNEKAILNAHKHAKVAKLLKGEKKSKKRTSTLADKPPHQKTEKTAMIEKKGNRRNLPRER